EESTGRVREPFEDHVGELAGEREPALVERRLVQGEQAVGEIGAVLEQHFAARSAVFPRPTEPPVRATKTGEDRLRGGDGGHLMALGRGRGQEPRGVGQRGNRESIPCGECLVVAGWLRTCRPSLEQPR